MVEVFAEVRRVLRPTGTLWLNLGDSYIAAPKGSSGASSTLTNPARQDIASIAGFDKRGRTGRNAKRGQEHGDLGATPARARGVGLAPKNLVGMPWRVALALQGDGWTLRRDIIWSKPNPMPESVTDRPTTAHEYIFLMAKSDRYFYDLDAISEPIGATTHLRISKNLARQVGSYRSNGGLKSNGPMKAVIRSPKVQPDRTGGIKNNQSMADAISLPVTSRNSRSVWTIPSQPHSEAHFATFPDELARRCILAGCPAGGVVLDPFAGSGTTLAVARDLGRRSVGIELNPNYVRLIEKRVAQLAMEMAL
jgi:DNA modification methylase